MSIQVVKNDMGESGRAFRLFLKSLTRHLLTVPGRTPRTRSISFLPAPISSHENNSASGAKMLLSVLPERMFYSSAALFRKVYGG
ncbi:hypothetical protein CSA37_01575 [Candidatus Fermentibacteria bacterium]|nr:MAG: hypothetical protein CSA37_01575 [Candidatus Fermentibacteria bacterium]